MKGQCRGNCTYDHFSRPLCNEVCNSNCEGHKCRDSDGYCFNCIDHTFYGNYCNISVGEDGTELQNCEKAEQDGETCTVCKHNIYFGQKCENECSEGCESKDNDTLKSTCKINGKCTCLKNYYGFSCNQSCFGCGEYGCDDQGYCNEFKCVDGKYGLKCVDVCDCESNSNSLACGKFSGECLKCKFGYFGTNCQKHCNYKCQTGLCCIFKEEHLAPRLNFKTNYKYLDIKINNVTYKIEIDYNYGYPLTLFNTRSLGKCEKLINSTNIGKNIGEDGPVFIKNFTNYEINGELYKNCTFSINDKTISNIDVVLAEEVNCKESFEGVRGVYGVIGLGFFNSVSNALFQNSHNEQNILFYSIDEKDNVQLMFGSMPTEQSDYIEKLTSCQVVFKNNTDIQGKTMTCKLDGIKSSKHSYGLRLNDANITFSLGQKSSFVLKNESNYKNFLKNQYFTEKVEEKIDEKTQNTYFLYPANKINKLPNFGFVFNNFYYSYEPNLFFEKNAENGKKRFLIEFSKDYSAAVLGKEFLQDIKYTINNEEARIYFYAKNAELCEKLVDKSSGTFRIQLEAREIAAIFLSVVIFINIVAFVIYYFLKKKKMNSNDYIRID